MKKLINNLFWIPTVLLLAIMILIIAYNPVKVLNAESIKGRLDLQDWDESNVVRLSGEWQYFDGLMIQNLAQSGSIEYVKVPHLFARKPEMGGNPYGVATYKLQVEGLNPDVLYGMQILSEVSAYRMTVNGEDVLKAGTVSGAQSEHRPEMKEKVGRFKSDQNGNAEILFEISNFSYNYGGFWKEITIGRDEILTNYASRQDHIEILLFASILVLGMFLLGLYSINHEFKPLLYFSLICILISVRILLTNNRQFFDFIYDISWDTGTRLEFLTGYLQLPMLGLFFYSLDYVKRVKPVQWLFYLMIAASFAIMIFTPNEIYQNLLPAYIKLCVASIAYFGYIVIQGIMKKKTGSILILIGLSGFIPTILIDFYGRLTNDLIPFGTFFMLIFFSIVVINNVFLIKTQHDYLEEAIMIDPLTGLKNRYFINRLMDQGYTMIDRSRHYILFFDLDKFKLINDNYGHTVGDAILKESASRIQECLHRDTDIICRYGGDEFIAFVAVRDQDGVIQQMIERLLDRFKEPFLVQGQSYTVSTSIGVSEFHLGDNLEKIIKDSDNAMYRAKKTSAGGIMIIDGQVSTESAL